MKIGLADYALIRLSRLGWPVLQRLSDLEMLRLRTALEPVEVVKPVFIAGLARSGTTILLQSLARTDVFATHRYRDFPFLSIPFYWNTFLDRFANRRPPVERPHRDRITITANSPEAFEEPIWQAFFPHVHDPQQIHVLDAATANEAFERFFRVHLRKILLIRGRRRYLSKGNYNVTRLEYLLKMFPDARFIIPIRNPFEQVSSLVRQHQLFTQYAAHNARVAKYLAAAGHYEFGPQRRAIRLTHSGGDQIEAAWNRGDDLAAYAMQWAQVYQHVYNLQQKDARLARKVKFIRYEDFCADPQSELSALLEHADVGPDEVQPQMNWNAISRPKPLEATLDARCRDAIWSHTESTARLFGYEAEPTRGL